MRQKHRSCTVKSSTKHAVSDQADIGGYAEASTAAGLSSQRVQMSRTELELYVKGGRPTGLLLSSVALLKGIDADAVAKASGIPVMLVKSIFEDRGLSSIKNGTIKRVAAILGIDLSTMRFAAGQVHVFDLGNAPRFVSDEKLSKLVRGVGLLARGARVAELRVGSGLLASLSNRKMFVAQSDSFRALFSGARLARFDVAHIPGAKWARGKKSDSVVPVDSKDLIENLRTQDITEGEFDELFMGADAFTWDDVRVASRVNGVSKDALMEFIRSRAAEIDESEDTEAKRLVNEGRPAFLRLVESELKVAAG